MTPAGSPKQQLKRMQALYSGEATMADNWLGGFLKKVDDLKLRDNTMLVLLSDHGFAFGEHGTSPARSRTPSTRS